MSRLEGVEVEALAALNAADAEADRLQAAWEAAKLERESARQLWRLACRDADRDRPEADWCTINGYRAVIVKRAEDRIWAREVGVRGEDSVHEFTLGYNGWRSQRPDFGCRTLCLGGWDHA